MEKLLSELINKTFCIKNILKHEHRLIERNKMKYSKIEGYWLLTYIYNK